MPPRRPHRWTRGFFCVWRRARCAICSVATGVVHGSVTICADGRVLQRRQSAAAASVAGPESVASPIGLRSARPKAAGAIHARAVMLGVIEKEGEMLHGD